MTDGRLAVAAITFDFGNTLVPVGRTGSRAVLNATAQAARRAGAIDDEPAFVATWAEERDRQFREDVPELREVVVPQRAARVLARLRGMSPPAPDRRWDDAAAARLSSEEEIEGIVDAYSGAFVAGVSPAPDAFETLQGLSSRGFRLAILSNWPLAATIDRCAEAFGWMPFLHAVVVSQRVGTIKPHPSIFHAAADALGMRDQPALILHVGDDWAADVVGARGVGWRTTYVRNRQADTPLPTSQPGATMLGGETVSADLEIDELSELGARVELAVLPAAPARAEARP